MDNLIISELRNTRVIDSEVISVLQKAFSPVTGLISGLLLGSRARGDSHARSNADVQLVADRFDLSVVDALKQARQDAQEQLEFPISVNVHTEADVNPLLARWGLFVHKNRSALFVYQAKYMGVPLFGTSIFDGFPDPAPTTVRTEAIRVLASFAYFLRKYLFDSAMAPHGAAEFARTPLIAVEYIAGFHGYLSMGHEDGRAYLSEIGALDPDDIRVLDECAQRKKASCHSGMNETFPLESIRFLERAHRRMVDLYRRRGVSDIRWDGHACSRSWNLDHPQAAAMTIIRAAAEVLLLRRPPDDYLYPGQWTIPGGYLHAGEIPVDAAVREVYEETGVRAEPIPLFGGQPVVNNRLAAFCFEVGVPTASAPRLSEHDRFTFVRPDQARRLDLTPEARKIVDRYLA